MIEEVIRTEKAVNDLMNNKIHFIVNIKATKPEIKKYLEEMFKIKVESIRTHINMKGQKIAIVKLAKDFSAQELYDKLLVG